MLPTKQLRGVTVSNTPPSNPQNGDRWLEVNSSGVSLFGWEWHYRDAFWVSPTQVWTCTFDNAAGGARDFLTLDSRFRYGFLTASCTSFQTVANNSSNHWIWQFQSIGSSGGFFNFGGAINTSTVSTPAWTRRAFSIAGTFTNNSSLGFCLNRTLIGNPGAVSGSVSLFYQHVRL